MSEMASCCVCVHIVHLDRCSGVLTWEIQSTGVRMKKKKNAVAEVLTKTPFILKINSSFSYPDKIKMHFKYTFIYSFI